MKGGIVICGFLQMSAFGISYQPFFEDISTQDNLSAAPRRYRHLRQNISRSPGIPALGTTYQPFFNTPDKHKSDFQLPKVKTDARKLADLEKNARLGRVSLALFLSSSSCFSQRSLSVSRLSGKRPYISSQSHSRISAA